MLHRIMLPARQLDPPDWMTGQSTVRLMELLGGYDAEAQTLFVGGCVRNALLGRPVTDIDIATIHHPLKVIDILKTAGIRFAPTGLDHGTVTAFIDNAKFEITTLRKDIDTDGRHAVIAFTADWREDAMRRDFTINTLLASPAGKIFDPIGGGLHDLAARRVVFVGNPQDRIAEDYLRILRFFRFFAQYGEGEPDGEALTACGRYADKIASLSRERVTDEFLKIIALPKAAETLNLMFSRGILKALAGRFHQEAFQELSSLQTRYAAEDVMARLHFLKPPAAGPEFFDESFMLSNAQKKYLALLAKAEELLTALNKKQMREVIYRVGNKPALQAYFIRLTSDRQLANPDLIDIIRYWQPPSFPIGGERLLAAGFSRGPILGEKLKSLEEAWIKSDFTKLPKI